MNLHPAKFWSREDSGKGVICELCPHQCRIPEGKSGICRARVNHGGELFTKTYEQVVSLSLDPVEKKPLYHFFPGDNILSTGPRGCNFSCQFCQNWSISQTDGPTSRLSCDALVGAAISEKSIGVAYTYTEPTIAFEYVIDCGERIKEAGLRNVLVTNGFINPGPLVELLGVIDAFNIDLKALDDDFYRKYCGGQLEPVLDSIKKVAKSPSHLEITNLLIPGYNDSEENISALVDFVASLDRSIPVHFSGYYPCYKFTAPPTPVEILIKAFEIASEKLDYVYVGNRRTSWGNNTLCPKCDNLLVRREGFGARIEGIDEGGHCDKCGRKVDIIGPWSNES